MKTRTFLFVDHSDHWADIVRLLRRGGVSVDTVHTIGEARTLLAEIKFKAIILECILGDEGLKFAKELHDQQRNVILCPDRYSSGIDIPQFLKPINYLMFWLKVTPLIARSDSEVTQEV